MLGGEIRGLLTAVRGGVLSNDWQMPDWATGRQEEITQMVEKVHGSIRPVC